MGKISIAELSEILVDKHNLRNQDSELFVASFFEIIQKGLEKDKLVKIKGLGTFKIIDVEARESINVNTGERVLIEGHNKITFTPDASMKELVNKPFSQFDTVILNEGVEFDDMPIESDEQQDNDDSVNIENQNGLLEITEDISEEIPIIIEPVTIVETQTNSETTIDSFDADVTEEPIKEEVIKSDEIAIPQEQDIVEPAISDKPQVTESEEAPVLESQEEVAEKEITLDISEQSVIEDGLVLLQDESISNPDVEEVEHSEETDGLSSEEVKTEDPLKPDVEDSVIEQANPADESTLSRSLYVGGVRARERAEREAQKNRKLREERAIKSSELADSEFLDDSDESSKKWWFFIILAIVLIVAAAYGGYRYGLSLSPQNYVAGDTIETFASPDTTLILPITEDTVNVVADTFNIDSVADSHMLNTDTSEPFNSDYYDQLDERVRTGAYRIVGLDTTLVVRNGETMRRLCKRTLGPGMACYIEVFNGMSAGDALQPGTRIKIPKLEWRFKDKK